MQDRTLLGNGKSSTLRCPSDYAPADFAEFLLDLKNGRVYVDMQPNNDTSTNQGVSVVGTPLNKANLMADATAQKLGLTPTTATPEEAFEILAHSMESSTVTFLASGWSNTAPYTQTVSNANIKGLKAVPVWSVDPSGASTLADKQRMLSEANAIGLVETGTGTVTATCYANKPSVNIVMVIGE